MGLGDFRGESGRGSVGDPQAIWGDLWGFFRDLGGSGGSWGDLGGLGDLGGSMQI